MGATKLTTDHAEIQKWASARGGLPAQLLTPEARANIEQLMIRWPGVKADEPLEIIDWEAWFRAFDSQRLAFLYEDDPASEADEGAFCKVVSRARIGSAE